MTHTILGFIGIGLMGKPMAERLLNAGFTLNVWNRNADKCLPLVECGANSCDSVAQLVEGSDVILLCVSDTDAVQQILFEREDSIAKQAAKTKNDSAKIIIDFSSIDPSQTKTMAQSIKQQGNIDWIDCPVSGGVIGAEQGTLVMMCGGDAQLIEQIMPILKPLSQRVTHMGEIGAGQVTKICNQMLVSTNILVMAEMMALAEKSGVDASKIPQALQGGFADSIPLQLTGPRMAERDFLAVKWHVKTLLKDLDMATTLAKASHSSVPMAGLGAQLMRLHATSGFEQQDPSTCIQMYSDNSNNKNNKLEQ